MSTTSSPSPPHTRLHSPVRLRLSTSICSGSSSVTTMASPPRSPALPPLPGCLRPPDDGALFAASDAAYSLKRHTAYPADSLPSPRGPPSPGRNPLHLAPLTHAPQPPSPPLYIQGPSIAVPVHSEPPPSRWSADSSDASSMSSNLKSGDSVTREAPGMPPALTPAQAYKLQVQQQFMAQSSRQEQARSATEQQLTQGTAEQPEGRRVGQADVFSSKDAAGRPNTRRSRPKPIYTGVTGVLSAL